MQNGDLGLFVRRGAGRGRLAGLRLGESLRNNLKRAAPQEGQQVYLGIQLVYRADLHARNLHARVWVDGGESSADWHQEQLGIIGYWELVPKNLFEVGDEEAGPSVKTSTRPGRSCRMRGTWPAKIPRSPSVDDTFTWPTAWSFINTYVHIDTSVHKPVRLLLRCRGQPRLASVYWRLEQQHRHSIFSPLDCLLDQFACQDSGTEQHRFQLGQRSCGLEHWGWPSPA
jgi:hypothetical protein